MDKLIPFARPEIGDEEIAEVVDSLKSGWISTGPKTQQFEQDFAKYLGVKHALAVNSATAGLHLSLDAIDLKSHEIVITTPYTFTATAEVIRYFNAKPVFCDIDESTFNIDIKKLEALCESITKDVTQKIKAIIPVHFAGLACNMDEINRLSKKYNFYVIEDAAHAFTSEYNKKAVGTLSDLTVFSFYATKTITTGEGGMITTNNDSYANRIRNMRLHGINRDVWNRHSDKNTASWYYEIVAPGFKYNLTDIASSIGIWQLRKAERFRLRRKQICKKYDNALSKYQQLTLPYWGKDKHSHHLYPLRLPLGKRDFFIEEMKKRNIICSVHFIPLHFMPYWKEEFHLKENDFPVASECYRREVSLPLFSKMTDEEVERVINVAIETIKKF